MSLTFPLTMPSLGAETSLFEIARVDYQSPETGGRLGGITAGFPLWRLTLALGPMAQAEGDAWRAFVAALRGAQRTFLARDLLRPYPAAYRAGFAGLSRAGGGAFDGTATSWSVSGTADALTLNGLPAGLTLAVGDLVSFSWSPSRRALVRVIAPATASGAGVAVAVIEPALPSLVPSGAVATLAQPDVVMRLIPGETAVGDEDTVSTRGGRIVAVQDLRP